MSILWPQLPELWHLFGQMDSLKHGSTVTNLQETTSKWLRLNLPESLNFTQLHRAQFQAKLLFSTLLPQFRNCLWSKNSRSHKKIQFLLVQSLLDKNWKRSFIWLKTSSFWSLKMNGSNWFTEIVLRTDLIYPQSKSQL